MGVAEVEAYRRAFARDAVLLFAHAVQAATKPDQPLNRALLLDVLTIIPVILDTTERSWIPNYAQLTYQQCAPSNLEASSLLIRLMMLW